MMRSITSRNDRATAAYTTSSGKTIRTRTVAQPPPASETKGICTSNIIKATTTTKTAETTKTAKTTQTAKTTKTTKAT